MNRRSLLKALCLTPVAAFVAPLLPKPKPVPWRVNRPYPSNTVTAESSIYQVGDTFTIEEGFRLSDPTRGFQRFVITATTDSGALHYRPVESAS